MTQDGKRFPPAWTSPEERDSAWEAAGPDAARAYAKAHESENNLDFAFEDFEWVYVPRLPLADLGGKIWWQRWWREQRDLAARNGIPDMWETLLDEPIEEPVVFALGGRSEERFLHEIWDGNHRVGASVITDRSDVPAVVGIPRGMPPEDIAPSVRQAVEDAIANRDARWSGKRQP
jgi:hypothetical protein